MTYLPVFELKDVSVQALPGSVGASRGIVFVLDLGPGRGLAQVVLQQRGRLPARD